MTKRKIGIVGSRTFPLPKVIWENLDLEQKKHAADMGRAIVEGFVSHLAAGQHVVVSGGADGTDSWAVEFAEARGIETVVIRPNYKKHGRGATFKRNTEIVLASDDVLAFWDGASKGTLDTVRKAHKGVAATAGSKKRRVPYAIIGPDGNVKLAVTDELIAASEEGLPKFEIPKGRA